MAERAQFIKTDDSLFVLLKRGRIHSDETGLQGRLLRDFEQIAQPLGIGGTNKIRKREWRGVYEMSLGDFMKNRSDPHLIDMVKRHYASEAVKRFVVPDEPHPFAAGAGSPVHVRPADRAARPEAYCCGADLRWPAHTAPSRWPRAFDADALIRRA